MNQTVQKIYNLLDDDLYLSCPVLSGNMRKHILTNAVGIGTNEITICISAPFYDSKKWKEEHVIFHTGEIINGKSDYAEWVNTLGPFGRPGRSQHWVNRACYEVATVIANEIGAEVISELPLN